MKNKHPNKKQEQWKHKYNKCKTFKIDEEIYYYSPNKIWFEAKILSQLSPLVYLICFKSTSHQLKAHVDHLKGKFKNKYVPMYVQINESNHVPLNNPNVNIPRNPIQNNENPNNSNHRVLRPRTRRINYKV